MRVDLFVVVVFGGDVCVYGCFSRGYELVDVDSCLDGDTLRFLCGFI